MQGDARRREPSSSGARSEVDLVLAVQRRCGTPPVVGAARALSHLGEHSAAWLLACALGAAVDAPRRAAWVRAGTATFAAHAAAVVVKRLVRRPRPHDPRVAVHVGTPSALSFPSAHAAGTTAFAVALAPTTGPAPAGALVGVMVLSRVVLGVHYPSDVAAGALVGALAGRLLRAGGHRSPGGGR